MIRSAFFSAGLVLVLNGCGLLFVDKVTLTERVGQQKSGIISWVTESDESGRPVLDPPDWMPLTLIGVGGVTMLYAVALPRS